MEFLTSNLHSSQLTQLKFSKQRYFRFAVVHVQNLNSSSWWLGAGQSINNNNTLVSFLEIEFNFVLITFEL